MLSLSRKIKACVLGLLLAFAAPLAMAQEKLPVVTSFSILADMVRQIGGDLVDVSSLVGPNSDAHGFEPTPADAKKLAQAKLVVVNGLNFEGWTNRLIKSSGYKGEVIVASKGSKTIPLASADKHSKSHAHGHDHGTIDPHAWQSLDNAKVYVRNISSGLIRAMPGHTDAIKAREKAYLEQIDALNQKAKTAFSSIPAAQRRAITSHDAFGYLARAYGIQFFSPQGWSTSREASAADVARINRQIRDQKITALFLEKSSDGRLLDRIARDTGVKIGGTLYSDALSAPGTEADTYLKMYANNVDTLIQGLQRQ